MLYEQTNTIYTSQADHLSPERDAWVIRNASFLQSLEPQETHSSISTEAIFKRPNAVKMKRKRQHRQETEKRESGGLELEEGHISSHWAGNSEKSPWLLKNKKSKAENSCRGIEA